MYNNAMYNNFDDVIIMTFYVNFGFMSQNFLCCNFEFFSHNFDFIS